MNEILFHCSWWLLTCVAAGGIAVFVYGNRRLDKKIQRIGLIVLALAVVLGLLRFFFPTARERMEDRSRAIVRAVDRRDWEGLRSQLDPATAVFNRTGILKGGRDEIIETAKAAVDTLHTSSISILGVESVQTETLITVSLEISSVQEDSMERPVPSSWQMEYEQSGDQWILEKIILLRVGTDDYSPNLPASLE